MRHSRHLVFGALALAVFTVFPAAQSRVAPPPAAQTLTRTPPPRLVVLLVVDQMRADYLERYKAQISKGFRRLTSGGAVFTQAYYPYASTETAQGHALMLSGQSPAVSGVVGDTWYDRQTGTKISAAESPDHKLLDGAPRGGSPEQLQVHTLGDAMKEKDRRTIVLTASYKRYSSVMMGGQHADAAYWFDVPSGHMVTSDYYRSEYPAWVKAFNATDRIAPFLGKEWMGHRLGTAIGYDANATASQIATVRSGFAATPYANDMLLEFVTRLLDNTELGRDDVPDVLGVSFSATDAVGHDYGPETPEFDEVFRQTDRQINELMDALDRRVGRGMWTLALVADHGASFLPEKQKERGLGGGRLSTTGFRAAVVKDLSPELNDGAPLISAFEPPEFYLDYAEAARRGISAGQLETAVAAAALKQEGIARVYTRSQIMGGRSTSDPILRAVFEGFYPSRSGDIYMVTKPNYIFKEGKGTTHGTPYEYDQHVPLIFYGRGIAPGSNTEHVQINDLAPTLAAIAGIEMPRLPGKVLGAALAPAPARR